MHRALMLALALLVPASLAGCADLLSNEDAPAAAADPEPEAVGIASAPEGTQPEGSSASPAAAPPSSSGSTTATNTSASAPTPDPPAPPTPVAWNVSADVGIGWLAAVGAPDVVEQGHADADHCASATFTVPEGAALLSTTLRGEVASPSGGAGSLYAVVTDPMGTSFELDPYLPTAPGEAAPSTREVIAPASGTWTVALHATGPVVRQSWVLAAYASGTSLATPEFPWENTCAA